MSSKSATTTQSSKRAFVIIGGTSEPGGLHVHSAELAIALAQGGHPVTILCPSVDFFSSLVAGTPVSVRCCEPPAGVYGFGNVRRWCRIFERTVHELPAEITVVSAIVCRGQAGQDSVALVRAARRVFDHVVAIEHRVPDPDGQWKVRLQSRAGLTQTDRSIAVSEAVRTAMTRSLGFAEANVMTCPNWVDPVIFSPDAARRAAFRRSQQFDQETFVVGFVGRLAPEKRVDVLIDGFAVVAAGCDRDVHLVLCGGGWKEQELRAQVERLGLCDQITFSGWQANPADWYRAFDCFVLPSELEGMPVVLLEAMASALPCLVHPFDAAPECIETGVSGEIASLDTSPDVAQALERLISSSDASRQAMGQHARERVLQKFTAAQRMPPLLRAIGAEAAAQAYERLSVEPVSLNAARKWRVTLS